MHYKAKVKLIEGGWYKDIDGNIWSIEKCKYVDHCHSTRACKGLMAIVRVSGSKVWGINFRSPGNSECLDGPIRSQLIAYIPDEEIALYKL